MVTVRRLSYCTLAGAIRFLLMSSEFQKIISDRVEVSTALNSWKRVTEGVYLRTFGIDPYAGDLFHETPLGLWTFTYMHQCISLFGLKILFIIIDLITAWFLFATAQCYVIELAKREQKDKKNTKDDELSYTPIATVAKTSVLYVPAAYLFNPYIVLNCVGQTTTVFTNFLYSATLYSMIRRTKITSCILISLLTLQNLYPMSLIVPTIIYIVQDKKKADKIASAIFIIILFSLILSLMIYASYLVNGSWSFLDNTLGFILLVPDLRPNIGLYWYFFTEMFEHFRWLFIASFQINVGMLYIVPLAFRLRRDPMLLAFAYLSIITIFKSYPSVGDVGFYMALLPMWQHLFQHDVITITQLLPDMQQGFIVGCFMLFCTVFAPTVWHQWIYSRSANANFYFGVTLAFAIAQIFLLTDLLFASIKRELALCHGLPKEINGKKAKLILE